MAKHTWAVLLGLLLLARPATAGDWDDTLRGGLIGGAFGALVSGLDGVDARTSVPAFAALGALAGYGRDRGWYRSRRYDDCWVDYGWPDARGRYYDDDWRWLNRRQYRRYVRDARPMMIDRSPVDATVARSDEPPRPAPDLHPGVSIVVVPITLPRGMTVELRILKLGTRYIGPQGEPYDTLPTAEQLQARYAPSE